jgi:hypothetical protein
LPQQRKETCFLPKVFTNYCFLKAGAISLMSPNCPERKKLTMKFENKRVGFFLQRVAFPK